MILLFYSRTGITRRIASLFNGQPIPETGSVEEPYILMVPSYGEPRTGNHVPKPVKKFLKHNSGYLCGVVGVGNLTFGGDFCAGARKISKKYKQPLITCIDMFPTNQQINLLKYWTENDKKPNPYT